MADHDWGCEDGTDALNPTVVSVSHCPSGCAPIALRVTSRIATWLPHGCLRAACGCNAFFVFCAPGLGRLADILLAKSPLSCGSVADSVGRCRSRRRSSSPPGGTLALRPMRTADMSSDHAAHHRRGHGQRARRPGIAAQAWPAGWVPDPGPGGISAVRCANSFAYSRASGSGLSFCAALGFQDCDCRSCHFAARPAGGCRIPIQMFSCWRE
jgi:hypothetical protein